MSATLNPVSATLIVNHHGDNQQAVWHFQNPLFTQEVSGEEWFGPYAVDEYTFSISANATQLSVGDPDHAVAKMIGSLSQQLSEAKTEVEEINESSFRAGYQAALNDLQSRSKERFGEDDEEGEDGYESPRCLCPDCTN